MEVRSEKFGALGPDRGANEMTCIMAGQLSILDIKENP